VLCVREVIFKVEDSILREATLDKTIHDARELLRHTIATLAYRGGKTLRDAPPNFGEFTCGGETRTPSQILAHIGDLLDWALSIVKGKQTWQPVASQGWAADVDRFFAALKSLDDQLSSADALGGPVERIFQAPIADAFTHIGQIAMLRRLAGVPVRAENYFVADIVAGRVGAEQAAPKFEF
jgi:hypothetical protein